MKTVHKILWQQIRARWLGLAAIIGLVLLTVGFDVIAPWPFKVLIDNVLGSENVEPASRLAWLINLFHSRDVLGFFTVLVYFVSTFCLAIVEYVRSATSKRVIKTITAQFAKSAFKSLQSLTIGFYKKQEIGDFIYRLSYDVSALGELIEEGLVPLVTSSLYLITTIGIMLLIDVKLTLLSLTALPFLAFGLYSFNAYTTYATKHSENRNSAAFSFIEEALTHLKIIQAFSQEHRESRSFDEKMDTSLKSDVLIYRLDFLLTLLVAVVIAVSYSLIILYGIRAVFAGTLTTGLLIVFIFYLDNLTIPILSLISGATATGQSWVKISRMEDFFSGKTHLQNPGTLRKITHTGIRFENVSFKGDKHSYILRNVSFEIEEGKRTVIFGVNGSGKTSIVNLVMRFIDKPSDGRIYLGGVELGSYDLKVLRDAIAFVPQEITLFNESIRDNIAFGDPQSTIREVKHAARLADADEFIARLPSGYNFQVGEAGNFLSGGQRQRLMLARALMQRKAQILLFDETFSALDVKSREEVLHNLYEFSKGRTTIIVSNIFSIVSAADNVVVLNKGKVIYTGKASRLPRELSLYKMIIDNP